MITAGYLKDPNGPMWKNDAGMNDEWRDFMAKHMPGADTTDGAYVFAYARVRADADTSPQRGDLGMVFGQSSLPISAKIIVRRLDGRMAFVPEGQHDFHGCGISALTRFW